MADDENLAGTIRRVDAIERNQTDQAKTLTVLVQDVSQLLVKDAVNAEREKARDDWRLRTEQKLDRIYSLGRWVLTTFGAAAIALVVNFAFRGGFNVQ